MSKEVVVKPVESKSTGKTIKKGILGVIINAILIIFSASCIFPLVWMLYSSLKEKRVFNADIIGLPTDPSIVNYKKILSNKDFNILSTMH